MLLCRKMFSETTTAQSSSMPTPKARPPSDMMLRVMSLKYIRLNVPMTEIGMTVSMMSGVFHSWRKSRRIKKASIAP